MLEIQRKVEKKMEKKKIVLSYILTAGALLLLFLWAANTGSLKVSAKQLFSGLFVAYDENVATIYDLRFRESLLQWRAARQQQYPVCFCRPS